MYENQEKLEIKRYKKSLDYTYSYGVYPTIELLTHKAKYVKSILISPFGDNNKGIEEILKIAKSRNIKVITNQKLILKLGKKENTYAIGQFKKYHANIEANKNHIVLVNISDAGNLGTIIRSMIAFGFNDLAIIGDSVDIYDPRVIRASMGAIFQINFQKFATFEEYQNAFATNKCYPFMLSNSTDISKIVFEQPCSLILGNEGHGLEEKFTKIGTPVRIEQSPKIDSLNLAISGAIGMYISQLKKS